MTRTTLTLLCLAGWATTSAAQPTFTGAGVPAGYNGSVLTGVSADGQVAVGRIGYTSPTRPGRWTAAGGFQDLGTLSGQILGFAGGVSADGGVVFGYVSGSSTTTSRPFRWTAAGGMVGLGVPAGYDGAMAGSSSADGTATAVTGVAAGTTYTAMRWTTTGGFQTLSMPAGAGSSFSQAMSADGGTVVGQYLTAGVERAYRWTAAGGGVALPGQPTAAGADNVALGVSPNGAVVVGSSVAGSGQLKVPFVWSEAGGFRTLDLLPGAINGSANAVSADGGVVVGLDGQSGQTSVAWVYDAAGLRDLNAVAADQGVDLTGWKLVEANAIVGNAQTGYTIVGTGEHGGMREGFVLSGLQLTPVPEPAGLLLTAAGLPLAARRLRRR
jgi:uncharacterized membrane protein